MGLFTLIEHKKNAINRDLGGFRFSDNFSVGLPNELLVIAVAIPALLIF